MVSSILCLCICTCICVLSLLPGILALLKLLFYVHQLIVRVAGFQNCCFYSFPPPHQLLVAFCVTKGFLKGCALTVEFRTATCILFLQQVPVSSIWKGGGKKIDEKRCFDECVPYFNCLSGKVMGERDIRGQAWEGKHEKILHTKAKYWFLAWERAGWWDPSYQVMTHLVLS